MTDRTAEPGRGDGSAEDTFALVSDETRVAIVRALGEARGDSEAPPVLSFADLREALPVSIDSSKFNYHLQQLVGHFVDRTEDGYRLRPEGWTLYRTLAAGTLDYRQSFENVDAGFACFYCNTAVEAAYTGGEFTVDCPGCGYQYDSSSRVPATAVDEDDLLSRVDRYNRHKRRAFVTGVCPTCAADVDSGFVAPDAAPFDEARREAYVHYRCVRCGNQELLSLGEMLLQDPGVVAFCHDHGVEYGETPVWEIEFAATDRFVTVRSRDPHEVVFRLPLEDETLELVVDDDLEVVERTRL